MGALFPFFIDISGKNFLLVGGGKVAYRRAFVLTGFNPNIRIVAKNIDAKLKYLDYNKLCFMEKAFEEKDLEGADYVLATTDDKKLNAEITKLARKRGIPANDCSNKDNCDFYFPGIVQTKKVVIGVSAFGLNHKLAAGTTKHIKEKIESVLEIGEEEDVKKA